MIGSYLLKHANTKMFGSHSFNTCLNHEKPLPAWADMQHDLAALFSDCMSMI